MCGAQKTVAFERWPLMSVGLFGSSQVLLRAPPTTLLLSKVCEDLMCIVGALKREQVVHWFPTIFNHEILHSSIFSLVYTFQGALAGGHRHYPMLITVCPQKQYSCECRGSDLLTVFRLLTPFSSKHSN